jgi:2,4-dienoyl-CoA reductase-like NADH-dependent reductase (Old Yellow Enzyme family)/thioredoxin reductase
MATNYADDDHRVTDRLVAYHVARARGGVGLNIVEHTAVDPLGLAGPHMLAAFDDDAVPGLTRLAEAVHAAGGRIALQLQHAGRQADPETIGATPLAPSAVPAGRDRRLPRELTPKQIRDVVRAFGEAALRARRAGFDGVEVHMAHGYLGCSFLSPLLNQRTDAYGGDTQRRTRFAVEVLEAITRRCGKTFPVWCRVSADEFTPGGMALPEMQRAAPLLEGAGYCALHVSACIGETAYLASAPYMVPPGHLLSLAEGVARVVQVPVIGVGSLTTPQIAEAALANGKCSLVALGRPLLADPDWCAKAQAGRADGITPCILCNLGCLDRRRTGGHLCECVTNPSTGHESEWLDAPVPPVGQAADLSDVPASVRGASSPDAVPPRRVLVIGGGPAGMTAAAGAARRGHDVTLWERQPVLGGRLNRLAGSDRGGVHRALVQSLAGALDATGVQVCWQQEADLYKIAAMRPAALVIATGARPLSPREVLPEEFHGEYLAAGDYLTDPRRSLSELVVVLGGDESGCLAALELARRDHQVLVLERRQEAAAGLPAATRHFIQEALAERGVRVLTGCEILGCREGRVTALVEGEERRQFPPASIIAALGRHSAHDLADAGQRLGIPAWVTGDARTPGTLHEAIWEGAQTAHEI